ncbi:penicillin-binding protein 2 [Desulfohalotomaculum tongense]|uniref:peptidoglycan D,D-transpeptidase FtsI family protein n=1 Tax=Desulforadius tongensis TaxID=1216062 RepID=UPI001959F275|nr:penicillin-binding transpeptidase domain-containing protein [Desulforadius tongensis]MBM7854044.1 penicillin-binding protein 2 [Desulforadius tongensis]
MEYRRQKRMVLTFYLLLILFIPIIARLADVQLARGPEYARRALEQRSMKVVLEDIPRGDILDRNLKSLTGSGLQQKIVIFPSLMDDPQRVAESLAGILGEDTQKLIEQFARGSGTLPYPLGMEQIRLIKEANWRGVLVLPVRQRYYNQPLASHLIGHLGSISSPGKLEELSAASTKCYHLNDLIGQMGLEKYYEQQLKATRPERLVRAFADAAGTLLAGMGIKLETSAADPGRQHVVTTIDYRIQRVVERVMDKYVRCGAVVVMDVHTGDIVAMASRPNFHPARVSSQLETASPETFVDHCTALYQPGSIFKVIVAAAALEEGIVTEDTTFTCRGKNSKLVKCWYHPGHGTITFAEAFAQSCNPVFAQVGLQLGAGKIIDYARKFGLDNQTVIGYPVPEDKRQDLNLIAAPYNLVNSSIGQGPVLATPIQITAMMNTIINDGMYIPPRLVRELRKSDGTIVQRFAPGDSYKVISGATASQLREMLLLVVQKGGGRKALVQNYGSAGKTGSAEVEGQERVNAWFSGYAPVPNPRYVATVLVEQGISGSESAAPVFREIMEETLTLAPLTG